MRSDIYAALPSRMLLPSLVIPSKLICFIRGAVMASYFSGNILRCSISIIDFFYSTFCSTSLSYEDPSLFESS